jgi:hypothetical protein
MHLPGKMGGELRASACSQPEIRDPQIPSAKHENEITAPLVGFFLSQYRNSSVLFLLLVCLSDAIKSQASKIRKIFFAIASMKRHSHD